MSAHQLLQELFQRGIHLSLVDDQITIRAPKGTLTPQLRERIAAHKADLMALLRQHQSSAAHEAIPPCDLPFRPLSFAQQRIWFIDQMYPGTPAYNVPLIIQVRGALNPATLEQSINTIVRRHEVLRTTFALHEDHHEAVQVVAPALHIPLAVVDLRDMAATARRQEQQRLITAEAGHTFDLVRGPLMRVVLLHLGNTEHLLLITMHHIITDGWSMQLLLRELATISTALEQGGTPDLPDLSIQYGDFACWQHRWLQGERLQHQLAYWKAQLAEAPPLLQMPIDQPFPPAQSFAGARQTFDIPPPLAAALQELAGQEDATLYTVLLTTFFTLLHRYTNQDDILVGSPISGRIHRSIEELIGFFVNTLVVRADLSANPSFRGLLARVRAVLLEAYAHQDVPFEKLVEELHPQRDPGRNPLVQVTFEMQTLAPLPQTSTLSLQHTDYAPVMARLDMEWHIWKQADTLSGTVIYNTSLFNADTIQRLITHFLVLLESATAAPDQPIAMLPLLTPAEHQQIVETWNATHEEYPRTMCLHHLVEARLHATPDALALVAGDEQVRCRELQQRVERLARHLQECGSVPGTLIGICVERCSDMVVALLAILKTGGAYVPLDPGYPRERLTFMITDADLALIITQHAILANHLPPEALQVRDEQITPHPESSLVIINRHNAAATATTPTTGEVPITPEMLAYVIYTSGSTGKPRGVQIPHRAVVNFLHAMRQQPGLSEQDTLLAVTTLSFDIAVLELFLPLVTGACLVIASREVAADGEQLAHTIAATATTVMQATPATWRLLIEAGWQGSPALSALCGGEALPWSLAQQILSRCKALWNMYGPTETTIWSMLARIKTSDERIVIGRPIANTRTYVLDATMQPVPVGVPGELYIGGEGLAHGYLNHPDLTRERFVPDPFATGTTAAEPAAAGYDAAAPLPPRLYRTGDLVRSLPDGSLEFLSRIDQQVKLHGFRIELGEIEEVLRQHPTVQEAVALVQEEAPTSRYLAAYVVPDAAHLDTLSAPAADGERGSAASDTELLHQWHTIFDHYYRQQQATDDPLFNPAGWLSSYTGQPIPAAEMREWLHDAAEVLRSHQPRRVLEIGCGTGMLLFQLAPHCQEYYATDPAPAALDYIRQQLADEQTHITLLHQPADDSSHIPAAHFDMVVLNSVVQYFPSVDYLLQVLDGAMQALAPDGILFVGDVRSLPLLRHFHTSVQLFQAEPDLLTTHLKYRVQARSMHENELVIDPVFFAALRHRYPAIRHVELLLKRGEHDNEMTRYRYNALLHVAQQRGDAAPPIPEWHDWQQEGLTLAALRQQLAIPSDPSTSSTPPDPPDKQRVRPVGITSIPNARIMADVQAVELLDEHTPPATARRLHSIAQEAASQAAAINPAALAALGDELGYQVHISWSAGGNLACFDVIFSRASNGTTPPVTLPIARLPDSRRPWHTYANHPLHAITLRQLPALLRSYLKTHLPDYMVPPVLLLLDSLPLTPNGKLDRRALPTPDWHLAEWRQQGLSSFEDAPHSPTEEVLLGIWRDVLGVAPARVYDNFFDLGGHSLLATRAIARVREAFGLEVPLRDLFEAPTLARFAQRIETRRASSLGAEATQVPPLQPVERSAALPLSFAQERLWFLHQLAPDSPAYTILTAVRLHGPLDTGTLEWCLQAIIQRHEVLRTTFPAADGQPAQHIAPPESAASYHLVLMSLEQTDDTATLEAALQQHAHQEVLRPYDLAHGPLLRATLLRLDERGEAHMLLLSMHHIISDAWSLELLVDELRTLYRERTTEALPTLPVQYADFACWQRAWLHGLVLEQQLAYWRTQLANLPPLLDLPTDYPRTASAAATAGYQPFTIAAPLAQALADLSKQAQATLFMTLLAAFQVLLARYSNQRDIPVGTPVANRTHHDLEHLIGLFVNTLVLRSDLADNPSFLDLLQQVRKTALEAYARQDVPFEMVVEALQPTRDLHHTPLFQVMVTLDRAAHAPGHPTTAGEVDGLTIEPYRMFPTGVAKFDLALMLWEHAPEQALTGMIEYRADLFAATTIAHMADHFQVLLAAIVADPRQPVLSLPLLTDQERQQTLDEWNATAADYPRQVCIHTMLEAQVEQTPDGIALVWEDTHRTYSELNHRANQLAHYLRSHGIGPDVVVGLCIERSFDFVVAAFAILKAGAAYLPMDPEYPPARLTFMLEDAQTPVVLTHQAGQDLRLAPQQPAPDTPGSAHSPLIINLAAEMTRATLTQQPTHNPDTSATGVTADHLAYVIYTSGSTGTPKGVEITHRSLVNLVCWHHRTFPLSPQDRATQVAGLGFDAAVWEVWPYLTAGAAIFFPDEETRLSPSRLRDWLVDQDITITLLTTPIAEQVLTLDWPQQCALRYLLTGGDTLRRYPAPELPFTLVNNYGPTEYTVVTTSTVVAPHPADSTATPARPPIGRPIANTRIYVLDEQMQPVPPGIPGELYIGGDGLARGYRNRPELTAQKFVADPFSAAPGARLYRTGDRVRFLPDGNIAFLGRVDAQVKLRGLRIEPGEIETVLTQHPFVQAAAVVAHEDAQGEKRLVAYIVLSAAAPRDTPDARHRMSELRRSLQTTLPTAMIPSAMLVLDALPLTRHGKLDRRALPAPDFAPGAEPVFASTVAYVAPRNHREETLADIWAAALGIDHVGVYDNFFELGGHSLMAARIVARIREVFQVDLPLRALFAAPTITDLAPLVAQQEHERHAAAAPPPPPLSTELVALFTPQPDQQYQPFPLTDVQQAYWIGRNAAFALGNVASHAYFEIESHTLEPYRFGEVWDRLILRHPMLRTIVLPDGQQQTLETVPPYYIEVQDLRGHDHQVVRAELAALRQHRSHQVFVPDQWPLFDVRITRLDDRRVRLHLSIDGLILDGWSLVLLSQEIARLYNDLDAPLPQFAITFRDYVLAETALQQTALYRRSLDYWLQRLETLPPAPALPLRQEPAAITHPRFTRHSQRLDRATWARLKVRASRAGLTPSGILVSAFAEVLTTWSSNPACTINLTFFNRIPFHAQVDQIIGDFTSLTLLQVGTPAPAPTADLPPATTDEPFEARARRTQQQLWNDLDHSYVSGVRVMRHLHRTRRDLPNALMPVVFTSMLAPDMHRRATTATQTRATAAAAPHRIVADAELVYSITQTPQVWLDHQVSEGDDEALLFNWDVVEDLFPAGLIDDMFHAYTRFLKRLARDESAWQLPPQCLAPSEQLEQHAAINATTQPFPLVRTSTATGQQREVQLHPLLHTMFEWQAKRHPHNNAIISSHLTLTYGELHRFASQLGRRLQALGATPNTLVAVVMEKGWEQIAAVLGILYAGAAYLPIAATLPQERRCSLLDNGAVSLVLTQPWLEQTLSWPAGVQVLALEYDDGLIDDEAADGFSTPAQRPTDLAYVLYTSGSTGTPKGVMIDHRAAVNTISDINRRFAVQPDDNVLALSSLSFDLSVYDIFGTLAAGATLVLPDAERSRDPAHWAELVQQEHITIWNSVPALMKLLVEYATQHPHINLSALRLVLLSGDWIPLTLPAQLRALNQRVEVISLGGATEAAIWSILYPIRRVEPSWRSIPYGFPMANQSLLVLNDHMAHCPVWVPGHLYIGGVGLAQGYWCDEARTAERFLRHPQSGERLYRTGDMGCYLPDGTIELLGREDLQVKIQGYRVEPGEVEALLERHPSVQAVAVVAAGPREERRLVACIVPTTMPGQPSALISELRQVVQKQVPAYMVPASFVVLDALPLTPNGKVDRQALAQMPAAGTADMPAPKTMPAAPGLLEPLQRLVAEVLHLEHVPPDADLLELGATSVDIIRIINRVEQQYGTRPPIGEFYLTPTIATLGRMVALARQPATAPASEPVPAPLPAPATPPEAPTPPQPPRLLRDPAERLAFKQQMPGVRRVSEAQPRIALSATPQHLYERAAARRSHRTFAQEVLPFAHLSRLLGALRQFTYDEQPGYLYPSAGGLYPVQTYLHIKPGRVEGFDGGIYYYHPLEHTLVTLAAGATLERTIHDPLVNAAIFDAAAFSIFLIARLGTMQALYGSYALEFCLLEAGAMSQALMMTAPEQHIGLCPIGDLNFAAIRHLFALEDDHQLLHSLLGGAMVEPGDTTEATRATDDVAYHFADQAAETEYEEGEV